MSKPVWERPQVVQDIEAIAEFLRAENPSVAVKFLDAAEAAYSLLSAHPASGSTRHAYPFPELVTPLRFHPIGDFPRILIYYLDWPETVEIVRLWDAARGLETLMETAPSK